MTSCPEHAPTPSETGPARCGEEAPARTISYPVGKLPQRDLVALLNRALPEPDPRVVFGPGLGRDAAVIDFGDRYMVTKTDPITFATDEIGWYVVNINANDVACLGARPRWFIITLLLPEGRSDPALVEQLFEQLRSASQELGVSVVGGHTEITHGIDRPIAVGAMFGDVAPEDLVRSDGAQAGDALILTKGIAVEGTAILARDLRDRLRCCLDPDLVARAADFLHKPGISVVRDAMIATRAGEVHAMHDPTEGGVATGIHEMIEAAGLGAEIQAGALPFFRETLEICRLLALDPLGVIASGSLLVAVAPQDADTVCRALGTEGIAATVIGHVREAPGVVLVDTSGQRDLPKFARDEIARLFEKPTGALAGEP
ncbi:MAG: AIR synthase family protein [Anaerolineae bacterium]|nr:AIR synthase family protein [Anaerolineae bacterium]